MKFYFLLFAVIVLSCSKDSTPSSNPQAAVAEIIKTEEAFSRMSIDSGFNAAQKAFMANDAVKHLNGGFPIEGADSIGRFLDQHSDSNYTMSWKVRRADISASGDLGYSWGDWMLRAKQPQEGDSMFGVYYTIWKKQTDGSWKWVLDGGSATPKPR